MSSTLAPTLELELDLEDLVARVEQAHAPAAGLVHVERLAARDARTGALRRPLPAAVWEALGVPELWCHQAEAIDLLREGRSVAIATGTASGKSLCYQAAIAEAIADPLRPASAMALFPTKALAHDQLRSLQQLATPGLVAGAYDGDASPRERTWVRANANVVCTNPEMLHLSLLPRHAQWATFLRRLRFVVIDELHVLRGVFGTHVAHLLRRLRRVCAHYGSSPAFVFTSATLGRPGELASALCGLPVAEVTHDGSPRGERLFVLWNPPLVDEATGARLSASSQTAALLAGLVDQGHRSIAFCASRKGAEVVAAQTRRRLGTAAATSVASYRGGYLPEERREIERRLVAGDLLGVVATSALELGIDIGGLDACVLHGFPGTIASMWQRAGRAGRERQQSLAVLVAGTDQLDQYLMAHPDEVFARPPEPAVINPANPFVLDPHLACAAFELPLSPSDSRYWGPDLETGVQRLVAQDRLRLRLGGRGAAPPGPGRPPVRAVWAARGYPARGVGLRNGSGTEVRIELHDGTLVGTVDSVRAPETVHPGARYLHRGRTFAVDTLDLHEHVAVVTPADDSESTQVRSDTAVTLLGADRQREVGRADLWLGPVEVRTRVIGYQRRDTATGELIETVPLDLPPTRLVTRAVWYVVSTEVVDAAGVAAEDLPGALHAAEHTAIGMLPLFTICDRWDVGGLSTPHLPETGAPTILIYDGYPGGSGIAELGFEAAERHLPTTLEVLRSCRCTDGCPSCVQSPKCGNGNAPLSKHAATRLLTTILG